MENEEKKNEGNSRVGSPGGIGFKDHFEELLAQKKYLIGLIGDKPDFPEAEKVWKAGGNHLDSRGGQNFYWFRDNHPIPHKGHLLFRYRNKLFSIFVDSEFFPFSDLFLRSSFLAFAEDIDAVPCILKMEQREGRYVPSLPGWGLTHAISGLPIDPLDLASDELIEMSDTELHHLAVNCTRDVLSSAGHWVPSINSFSDVEPSLFVQKDNFGRWVIVRAFGVEDLGVGADTDALRQKLSEIPLPADMPAIRAHLEGMLMNLRNGVTSPAPGLFAAVGFGSVSYLTKGTQDPKIYRGMPTMGMVVIQHLDRTEYLQPSVGIFQK